MATSCSSACLAGAVGVAAAFATCAVAGVGAASFGGQNEINFFEMELNHSWKR